MSLLSSLFKTRKNNLTPDVSMPAQEHLYFTNPNNPGYNLRNFAQDRIQGNNLGFGEDYVNKATNPVADSMRRNFRNVTSPFLSSQYSGRGLGRSSLAANAQGLAEGNVESGIGDMMAQFYQLNEAQKKTDQTQALNLAQNLQSQQASMKTNEANASADLSKRTVEDSRYRETRDTGLAGNLLGAGTLLAAPMMQPLGNALGGALGSLGMGGLASSLAPIGQALSSGVNSMSPVATKTLDNSSRTSGLSDDDLERLIKALGGR